MREWLDVHRQLLQLAEEAGLKPSRRRDDYDAVHRAILTGLLSSVALRTGTYEYTVAGGSTAYLWPGSALFEARPGWVMAAEVVETTRRYLRTCAQIDPRWIEPAAEHLVKRSYSEPHWDRASGSTIAFEKVSLFGLTVVPRRRVAYGPINPEHARELFIQHGLVEAELDTPAEFLRHNQELLDAMERLQAKLRRNDLILGEWSRYEFYDERVPDDVYDAARLSAWLQEAHRHDPHVLRMAQTDVIRDPVDEATIGGFPDAISVGQAELALEYRYEPGSDEDGLTLHVPVDALGGIEPRRLDWLVPGLLEPKVVALVKSLPKSIRRKLVPAADTAKKVLPEIRFGEGGLLERVAAVLSRIAGARITAASFQQDKLPPELRMNVRVEASDGQALAQGRDLAAVQRELGATISDRFARLDDPQWTRDGLVDWDLGELPEAVEVTRDGVPLQGYPALVDGGDSVSLRLVETADRARDDTRGGLRRLAFLAARGELRRQVEWLPGLEKTSLYAASISGFDVKRQLAELVADRAFVADQPVPRSREAFDKWLAAGRKRIVPAVQDVARLVGPLLEAHHQARLAVEQETAPLFAHAVADAQTQLDALVGPDFLTATPWGWLRHYPRFFRAVRLRFDKLRGGSLDRDRQRSEEIAARLEAYRQRLEAHGPVTHRDPELVRYRWMLEEYRVSLFAQELGTSIAVSAKRLDRQWAKIQD